ncbi:MAG: right-handed parallel beta-helix repeat-containing protein, partial [Chloroflexi bacterium]|nr:right-handed parallel beta-helix repeat-containing protein [Chloroflexota bacterium]
MLPRSARLLRSVWLHAALAGVLAVAAVAMPAAAPEPAAAASAVAAVTLVTTTPTWYGPTAYVRKTDSSFSGAPGGNYVEDFEDALLNTPGVTASTGSVQPPSSLSDSVDEDDGTVDGSGQSGRAWFSPSGATGVTFTFNASTLGSLPTRAGLVWTDGGGTTTFEAFDGNGTSLGVIGPVSIADGSNSGETAEDRFFGVSYPDGIGSLRMSNTAGGIEVDHLQYGPTMPGKLQFSSAASSSAESAGNVTITVNRTDGSNGLVGVTYGVTGGTATAGEDFTNVSGTLSWADGDTTPKTFTVAVLEDAIGEVSETVVLGLSSPTGGAVLGSMSTTTLTITDKDVKTLYVSPGGNTSNDCLSHAAACAKLDGALAKAVAGDTIIVASGDYPNSSGMTITKAGLTITGPGIGEGVPRAVIRLTCGIGIRVRASNVTIQGLEITATACGSTTALAVGFSQAISNVAITGNAIHDVLYGVQVNSHTTGVTVSGNQIYNNIQGIWLPGGNNVTIVGNRIFDNTWS